MSKPVKVVTRTMTPFGDTVVLEMLPDQDHSSKIVLPQGARVNYARARRAIVVDCGPPVKLAGLYIGAEVLVAPCYDGVEVDIPGTGSGVGHYRVVASAAIVAILSPRRSVKAIRAEIERLIIEESLSRIGSSEYEDTVVRELAEERGWECR